MKLVPFVLMIASLAGAPPPKTQIDVFAPVPKKGCPDGYYRVENAIFTGLNYWPACWSKRLKQIEQVEISISYDMPAEGR